MKNLIRFELRKILLNRLAIISLAAVFLLSLGLFFSTLQGMHAFDGKSAEGTHTKLFYPAQMAWNFFAERKAVL